jgi:hypothetical protein
MTTIEQMAKQMLFLQQQVSMLAAESAANQMQDPILEGFGVDESPDESPVYGGAASVSLFQIYDVDRTALTFKIRGDALAVSIAGPFKSIADYNGSVTESSYVYLKIDRDADTATIAVGTQSDIESLLSGESGPDIAVHPLWKLTVEEVGEGEEAHDEITEMMDCRYSKEWNAGV